MSLSKYLLNVVNTIKACFKAFCASSAAVIPIVVGRDAAHTPSLFKVDSGTPLATINGGAH